MPSKLEIRNKKKLSAAHKRNLMKGIFEEHFGITIFSGSNLDKFIDKQFRQGQRKNKFNDIIESYTTDTSPIDLANNISNAIDELCEEEEHSDDELLRVADFLKNKLVPIITILNAKNTIANRSIALNEFLAHTIESLTNKGIPEDSIEIRRLKNIQHNLKDIIALDIAGQIMQAAAPLLKMHDLLVYGDIIRRVAPHLLLITSEHSSIDDSIQATFASLYHIGEGLHQPNVKRLSIVLQNVHWLTMLDLHTSKASESLDNILDSMDLKLGQNTISSLKQTLLSQGIAESEAIEIFKLVKRSPESDQLIHETRYNQKFAAAGILICGIAKQIRSKELEKIAQASLCVVSIRQFYTECALMQGSAQQLTSLTQTTGMILESSGQLTGNHTLETIGKGILSGVSAYQLAISTLPGGPLVALPIAALNVIGGLIGARKSRRQQQAESARIRDAQHVLAYVKECHKCIIALHNNMHANFAALYRDIEQSHQMIMTAIRQTSELLISQHRDIKYDIADLKGEVQHLQYIFHEGFKELYLRDILTPLGRYELAVKIDALHSLNNIHELFLSILEWVLIKSKSTSINGYELISTNNTHKKYVLLSGIMDKTDDDLAALGAIEAYLRTEGFGSDFGLAEIPNLPIWLHAIEAIYEMLANHTEKLSLDVSKVYEILDERINEIKESLYKFASNKRLIEFLSLKIIEQYKILTQHVEAEQSKSSVPDYLKDFTTVNNKLLSEEQWKESLKKCKAFFTTDPVHGGNTNIQLDVSELFFRLIYPQIAHDLGIRAYLHTLSCTLTEFSDDGRASSFATYLGNQITPIPGNLNNNELLQIKMCYQFSIIRGEQRIIFAEINGTSYTGGPRMRHRIYQDFYHIVPPIEHYRCINMLDIIISDNNGVRKIQNMEQSNLKPTGHLSAVAELLQRVHNELSQKPDSALEIKINSSDMVSEVPPEALSNRDRAIKASMYVERTKLAKSLTTFFDAETLKKSSVYSRIINIILNLRGSNFRMPDILKELSKFIAGLTTDHNAQQNFEQILEQICPPTIEQIMAEEPNFTVNETLAELTSYPASYEAARANNVLSMRR